MKNWILRWVASVLALLVIVNLPIGIELKAKGAEYATTLIITVLAMGFVNAFVRPIIMFFAWPVNCLTFGLMGFVLNVALFWIVGSGIIPKFHVNGLMPALIGSVLMGALSGLFSYFLKDRGD